MESLCGQAEAASAASRLAPTNSDTARKWVGQGRIGESDDSSVKRLQLQTAIQRNAGGNSGGSLRRDQVRT
jgi:hypothetical protein